MIIIDKETGLEYETVYGSEGTHYMTSDAIKLMEPPPYTYGMPTLRLIPTRHTFDGEVYEETGEEKSTFTKNECFLNDLGRLDIESRHIHTYAGPHKVLKPVEITEG